MTGDSNINMVISQGNAVKEIYNVRKHDLDLQQQTNMQEHIKKNREEKTKIKETENDTKIQVKDDENRKSKGNLNRREEEKNKEHEQDDENGSTRSTIDIIV